MLTAPAPTTSKPSTWNPPETEDQRCSLALFFARSLAREYGCARRTIHDVVQRRGAYAPIVTPRPPMAGGAREQELPYG